MKKPLKRVLIIVTIVAAFYALILIYPDPLFKHQYKYKNFSVHSDREIPLEIEQILDMVQERLSFSELYSADTTFNLYFCNDDWRFLLFSRDTKAGAVVNGFISANAFFRKSDIRHNQLNFRHTWNPNHNDRPLSYFLAHELTHSLQSKYDRFMVLKTPTFVMEGYADYIGKGYAFNYARYKKMLINDEYVMKPKESGLYNLYHLAIAYLMDRKGYSYKEILKLKPDLDSTLQDLLAE